jgi:alkylated DNA repair dioxygenase AlkB
VAAAEHGDGVVMGGTFQKVLKHEIVKVGGARGQKVGPRLSVTLRQLNN